MDYTTLITPEHAGKPNFMATVSLLANGVGSITEVAQTLNTLFDLDTCVGAQEDALGEWVGQPRVVPNVLTLAYFGFSEVGGATDGDQQPFGELSNASIGAPFYSLGDSVGTTSTLNDAQYRTILRAAIVRNQYDGSLSQIEAALLDVFECPCAIVDAGLRSIVTVVSQPQSQVMQALVSDYDILPRPAGVRNTLLFPVSPITWAVTGTATASGTSAQKSTGTTGWDSSATAGGAAASLYLSWTVPVASQDQMGGLSASPATSPSYTNLNFGLFASALNTVEVYESGTLVGTYGAYAPGDSFAVCYDGLNVVYLHNSQIIRTTTTTGSFTPMFSFNTVGAEVQNVSVFAP